MTTEFEAKFTDIDKDEMRRRLKKKGAQLLRPEFEQKRLNFHLPGDKRNKDAWLRVRDEGDKVTLALKMITGKNIQDQKELSITVDDFDKAIALLEAIGCERKLFEITKRELWKLNDADITIDTWPGIPTFVEIEAPSEQAVKDAALALGFDYAHAIFGSVSAIYELHYNMYLEEIEGIVGGLTFDNQKLKALQPRKK
ncbi:MAG TPA: class IV adenylate cyclase [Candidatus Paceibacterota bacterium]|nr:class IV adenylate cyclase [Candidatus Paceibacterota bacterium]